MCLVLGREEGRVCRCREEGSPGITENSVEPVCAAARLWDVLMAPCLPRHHPLSTHALCRPVYCGVWEACVQTLIASLSEGMIWNIISESELLSLRK